MKRIYLTSNLAFALLLFVSNSLYAEPVSKRAALQRAREFMPTKHFDDTKALARSKTPQEQDAFYIFNADDGGYVIVSGDDRTEEILGFSDTGRIDLDNIPTNMKAWLDGYAEQILSLNSQAGFPKAARPERANIDPLIKTSWSQSEPYNWMCPEKNNRLCPTGCAATAVAQVMYYYKWPQNEFPGIDGYSTTYTGLTLSALPATTFEWDKMLTKYTSGKYTDEQGLAVSKLMRYIGQSLKMEYDLRGSAASISPQVLNEKFGFSKTARQLYRVYHSTDEWEKILYNELLEKRPILYVGQDKNSRHAFICDGYKHGYFHINWGWGFNNGFFLLQALNSNGYISGGYSIDQDVIIGIKLPSDNDIEGISETYTHVHAFDDRDVYIYSLGMETEHQRNSLNKDFEVDFNSRITSDLEGNNLFEGEIGLAVYRDTCLMHIIYGEMSDYTGLGAELWEQKEFKFRFGANWDDGDYTMGFIARPKNSDRWKNAHYSLKAVIDGYSLKLDYINPERKIGSEFNVRNSVVNKVEYYNPIVNEKCSVVINVSNIGNSYTIPLYLWIDDEIVTNGCAFVPPGETTDVHMTFEYKSLGKKELMITDMVHNKENIYLDSISFYSQDYVFLDNPIMTKQREREIPFFLKSKSGEYNKYQFKLVLPDGIGFDKDKNGSINLKNFCGKSNGKQLADGSYTFVVEATDQNQFKGDKIHLFSVVPKLLKDKAIGKYRALMTDIKGITTDGNPVDLAPCKVDINLTDAMQVNVETAGTLDELIPDEYKNLISELKLTGEINGTDLRLLRDMAGNDIMGHDTDGHLISLDMSDVRIVDGGDMYIDTDEVNSSRGRVGGGFHYRVTKPDLLPGAAFICCGLESIKLPETILQIYGGAFMNNKNLKKITIPNGVTQLANGIFYGCDSLSTLIFPSSLTHIGLQTINCKRLIVSSLSPSVLKKASSDEKIFNSCTLIVPKGSKEKYQQADVWKEIKNIEEHEFILLKADDIKMTIGDTIPQFTYTVEGGTLDGEPHFYCESDGKTPGTYEIKLRQGTVSNEYVIFMNGTLTISQETSIANDNIVHPNARIYDLQGNRLDNYQKGVNIIRMENGKTKKLVVK